MTFEEILEITKNRIDETYEDEQIDIIIQNAINHAYISELSKLDPTFKQSIVVIINGVGRLPSDLRKIQSTNRKLTQGEYRRGKYFFSPKVEDKLTILYEAIPEKLQDPSDEPQISEELQYLLTTKACEAYYQYRKKNDTAKLYSDEYERGIFEFKAENVDDTEEVIVDIYGGE